MDFVSEIIAIAAATLPIIVGFLTFLLKYIKNEKSKKILNETLKIMQALQPLIIKAEEYTHYSGEEKKQFVMTSANQFAIDNKMKFDIEKMSELIDELVMTTKRVNSKEKNTLVGII